MSDIALARGYRFAAVNAGIRSSGERRDLALVVSDTPASAAGTFTQNRVVAAPVQICRQRLPRADARGMVICAGNANACTGAQGLRDAERMTALAAEIIGCRPEQFLVCSTGVIGKPLPMTGIEAGIREAAVHLGATVPAFDLVAHAIQTTDTRLKISTRQVTIAGQDVRLTGFAKGAAMIGPNLATMLAFVLSDAAIAPRELEGITRRAANLSFNNISVEGHTSTNDTLLLFANGTGSHLTSAGLARFEESAIEVCSDLARAIAADAEGASHFVTLAVEGLRDDAEARRVAKAVAESPLVKTALFGADPNWGRIVSAAGYAGVAFEEEQVSLWLGDMLLYHQGTPQPFDEKTASAYLKNQRNIHIRLRFTLGTGSCTFWTCDLGYEYVRLNAEYTT